MEKAERELLLVHLAHSRERLVEAVEGLTSEQQHYRPATGRWSVADCVEHVIVVETNVLRTIQNILQTPPEPGKQAEVQGKEDVILDRVPSRVTRVQGPVEVMPCGRWPSFDELLRRFETSRERTLRFAAVTQANLREHFFPHPFLGTLDCYQWLLFLGAHCERHVRQLEEVMDDPAFPGSAESAIA